MSGPEVDFIPQDRKTELFLKIILVYGTKTISTLWCFATQDAQRARALGKFSDDVE